MTLLFVDGFDDGLLVQKWTALNNMSVTSGGRTGLKAFLQDNSDSSMRRTVQAAEEHATFIVGSAFNLGSSYNAANVLGFYSDTMATAHVWLGVDANNAIVIRRGDGTVLGTSAANTLTPGTWAYIEIKVVLGDGTSGSVVVRVNGVAVLTLTGIDTKNGGTKTVFESVGYFASSGPTGTVYSVDDFYLCNGAGSINNDFLGDCSVETIFPSGNGNSSGMVGSDGNSTDNYLLVDEAPTPSSSDYVASAIDGAKDTYAFADLTHTAGTVKGVQISAYAAKSDTGTRTMSNVIRSGGADTVLTAQALSTAYAALRNVVEQNPNGPAAWTIASVNAAEFGVQVGAP
jgi:hypothetical protein